ncbi:MAG: hypothetical protein VXZ38_13400 [Planctomycetota bacterium]|nr:hypothetical protein [Planctomycetota bacterium]
MHRRLNNLLVSSQPQLLTVLIGFGAVITLSDPTAAQSGQDLPLYRSPERPPVGAGVLLPTPAAEGPIFEIAQRPSFWHRFTTQQPSAARQVNPPRPPLVSDPTKMAPPSAVWTPPVDPTVVAPKPKTDSSAAAKQQADGWTQRERTSDTQENPVQESAIGSGLPATESLGQESVTGKLERATSVIRLLPVNSGESPRARSVEDSGESVVILKAPETEATAEGSPKDTKSSIADGSPDADMPVENPAVEKRGDQGVSSRRIASADDAPLPLRDPEDLVEDSESTDDDIAMAEEEVKTETTREVKDPTEPTPEVKQESKVKEEIVSTDPSAEATADSVSAPEGLTSSRRKIVMRDVKIQRDGSLTTQKGLASQQKDEVVNKSSDLADADTINEDASMQEEPVSEDLVNQSESDLEPSDSPVAIESTQPRLDYTGYPRRPLELSGSVLRMQRAMNQCLKYYFGKPESANVRSNWGMLHSIMVWGADTPIIAGNEKYNAIAWIAGNNTCAGKPLLIKQNGRMVATTGVGLQGHQAQFLAVLALCDVPLDYPLYAGGTQYTVDDLVKEEMLACRSGEELTFSLIGLVHYLDTETRWTNEQGETWDLPRLLREEMSQPIVGSACGGTHRLMGFAHALRKRRMEGREISGQWKRAEIYTDDFVQYAFRLQNRDGSMSTDWFEGREDNGSMDRKVQTTGHMVEWLLTVLPDTELQDPRLVNAVRYLTNAMNQNRQQKWKVGPKGHALRALAMFYDRVYREGPAWQSLVIATQDRADRR